MKIKRPQFAKGLNFKCNRTVMRLYHSNVIKSVDAGEFVLGEHLSLVNLIETRTSRVVNSENPEVV